MPTTLIGTVTWHVGLADGTILAVEREDRADASPVCVWQWRNGEAPYCYGRAELDHATIKWQHVADDSRGMRGAWKASPCSCVRVVPEPVPAWSNTPRVQLRAVA